MQPLLTIESAAELLSCSPATINRHIAAGRLSAINLSTGTRRADYRIAPDALQAFLETRTVAKPKYSGINRRTKLSVPNYFA